MIVDATEADWSTEYLSMDLAVRVVGSVEEATETSAATLSGHTEGIVASDVAAIPGFPGRRWTPPRSRSTPLTRFTDGGQRWEPSRHSTQKFYARGPMGLTELMTTTWIWPREKEPSAREHA